MKYFISLLFLINYSYAQVDQLKWHLDAANQELQIEVDDLHTETLIVNSIMDIGLKEAKAIAPLREIKIAVIDGGIDFTHPQISPYLDYKTSECFDKNTIPSMENDNDGNGYKNDCLGWNFANNTNNVDDNDGHGTHVTGLITDFFKEAPKNLKILPLKIFSGNTDTKPLALKLEQAFSYALSEDVNIIHLSLGWPESLMNYKLEKIINKVIDKGITIIAAAGNSKQRADIYPCKIKSVICIGALRANGNIASFSNYGSQVDFLLAGEKILSTIPMSQQPLYIPIKGYDYKNGTSQAAPIFTGAFAYLLSTNMSLSNDQAYARFIATANTSKFGLRGNINLFNAINVKEAPSIIPNLKGLNTLIAKNNKYEFSIDFENISDKTIDGHAYKIKCVDYDFIKEINLQPFGLITNTFSIPATKKETIKCFLNINEQEYSFSFKVLKNLPSPEFTFEMDSSNRYISKGRNITNSRLRTIEGFNKSIQEPLYLFRNQKEIEVYKLNTKIGTLNPNKGCRTLRVLQNKFNNTEEAFILHESICNDEFLTYHFYNLSLDPLFEPIKFIPKLTIVNYKTLTIDLIDNLPVFRFLNMGTDIENSNPWDTSNSSQRKGHFFELKVSEDNSSELYLHERTLDNFNKWFDELNYRFTPQHSIILRDQNSLLVSIDNTKYWVDINTMKLEYSNLEHLLLGNDSLTTLNESGSNILQALITPYDYRGSIINGVTLRYHNQDLRDPLSKIIGIKEVPSGFIAYIQSFYHLHSVSFNKVGDIISVRKKIIERFDFLKGDELSSLVYSFQGSEEFTVYLDGSHIHTQYIDILKKHKTSYKIPKNCVTQLPIKLKNQHYLVLACIIDKKQLLSLIPFNTL
jgi:hypothetical protein